MKKLILLLLFLSLTSCNLTNEEKKEVSNYIILNSDDSMLFDKNILNVEIQKKITLILNHRGIMGKEVMGHNFVLLKKNTDVENFAIKAMSAKEKDYIPNEHETVAYTKMIGGGESDTITFIIEESGTYDYICTFPGHYRIMRGKLIAN